ncbi:hypothetical protein LG21E12_13670 [Lactococcus garvieae]|jgi:hypothetical protein|uniref:Uncharacterized protein n=1 Tax=Lactococcus garvieae (strain Lg2) TaxID=420890 RepID=F9VF13_LACGL|nr:hypothetical protein OO3_00174 [Lactococcus garvieae ATCC 49156]NHI68381.1 hypothetical protein [Lactococcus garvieae]BAK60914.1 hypothetical protein LCGL_1454 [Lactococcus garvieae Lg2]EOT93026.1 hypothetical protein I578_00559 [Lactococcus garvieae ATCC 49156]BAK58946.1 hypothetical protein LCGT_1433 [Lactococcus garvieae ATCC 49156]
MNKSSTIKVLLMITFIIITVIVFRHVTFLSEVWNTVFLALFILVEYFFINKIVDKIMGK